MFRWMNRAPEAWSLATVTSPWKDGAPLFELVASDPAARLPVEEAGSRFKWAAGALDGIMGNHAGADDATRE